MSSKSVADVAAEEELKPLFQRWGFALTPGAKPTGKVLGQPEMNDHHDPVPALVPAASAPGWTSSAWGWVSSAAATAKNAGSGAATWTKTALSQLCDQDLLETAKKPTTQTFAADAGNIVRAAADPNGMTEVLKTAARVTTKYVKPEWLDNRVAAGTFSGATIFGNLCGPQCAVVGAVAGGLYGHLYRPGQDDGSASADGGATEAEEEPIPDKRHAGSAEQEVGGKPTCKL